MVEIEGKEYAIDRSYYGEMEFEGETIKFSVTVTDYPEQSLFGRFVKFSVIDWGRFKRMKEERESISKILTKELHDRWKEATIIIS